MTKRPFERHDQWSWFDSVARDASLSRDSAHYAIAEARGEDRHRRRVVVPALRHKSVDELLDMLSAGELEGCLAGVVADHADDPRVRPALIAALQSTNAEHLHEIAWEVGVLGGPNATEVLRDRFERLEPYPDTPVWDNRDRRRAHRNHGVVALSLLRVDPNASEAAVRLVRALKDAHRQEMYWSVIDLHNVYRHELRTEAMEILGAGIDALFEDGRGVGERVYARRHPRRATERARLLLSGPSQGLGGQSPRVILREAHRHWPGATVALEMWLAGETNPAKRVVVMQALGRLLPLDDRIAKARASLASESPAARLRALQQLATLPPERAADVATEAMVDEPDPDLREALRGWAEAKF